MNKSCPLNTPNWQNLKKNLGRKEGTANADYFYILYNLGKVGDWVEPELSYTNNLVFDKGLDEYLISLRLKNNLNINNLNNLYKSLDYSTSLTSLMVDFLNKKGFPVRHEELKDKVLELDKNDLVLKLIQTKSIEGLKQSLSFLPISETQINELVYGFIYEHFGNVDTEDNFILDDIIKQIKENITGDSIKSNSKISRKPIIYAAPGLGKTKLASIDSNYVDSDEIAMKVTGAKTPVEASTQLTGNKLLEFQSIIKELSKTKTILSSMSSSKLGLSYTKHYLPTDDLIESTLNKAKERTTFPFDSKYSVETYKKLYIEPYLDKNPIRIENTLTEKIASEEVNHINTLPNYILSKIASLPFKLSQSSIDKGIKVLTSRVNNYRGGFYELFNKHYFVKKLTLEALSFQDTIDELVNQGFLNPNNEDLTPEELRREYFTKFGVNEEDLDYDVEVFQDYINWTKGIGKRFTYSIIPVRHYFGIDSDTINEENAEEVSKKTLKELLRDRISSRLRELNKERKRGGLKQEKIDSINHKINLYTNYNNQLYSSTDVDIITLILNDILEYEIRDASDIDFLYKEYEFLKQSIEVTEIDTSINNTEESIDEEKLKLLDSVLNYINKEKIRIPSEEIKKIWEDLDLDAPVEEDNILKMFFISARESTNKIVQLISQTISKGISEIQDLTNKFARQHKILKEKLNSLDPSSLKDQSWIIDVKKGTYHTKYKKGVIHSLIQSKQAKSIKELLEITDISINKPLQDILKEHTNKRIGLKETFLSSLEETYSEKTLEKALEALSKLKQKDNISELTFLIEEEKKSDSPDWSKVINRFIEMNSISFDQLTSREQVRIQEIYEAVKKGKTALEELLLKKDNLHVNIFFNILHNFNQEITSEYYSDEYKALLADKSEIGKAKLEYYEFVTSYIGAAGITERLPYGQLPYFYKSKIESIRDVGTFVSNMISEKRDYVEHKYNKVTGAIESDFSMQGLYSIPLEEMDLDIFSVMDKFSQSLSKAIIKQNYQDKLFSLITLLRDQKGIRKDAWGKKLIVENDDKTLENTLVQAQYLVDSFLYNMDKDVDGVLGLGLNKEINKNIQLNEEELKSLNLTQEEKDNVIEALKLNNPKGLSEREFLAYSIQEENDFLEKKKKVITGRKTTDTVLKFNALLRLGFAPLGFIFESIQGYMGSMVEGSGDIIKLKDINFYLKKLLSFSSDKDEIREKIKWARKDFIIDIFLKGGIEHNKFMDFALAAYRIPNEGFNDAYVYSFLKNKLYNGKPLFSYIEKDGDSFKWSKDSGIVDENGNFTDNKYTYQEELRTIIRKNRERVQSTDSIMLHKSWWGRAINQFKGTWLYEGFYTRYGKGTNQYLGQLDNLTQEKNTEGFYRTAYNSLSEEKKVVYDLLGREQLKEVPGIRRMFKTIGNLLKIATYDKLLGNDYGTEYNLSTEQKENIEKAVTDLRIKLTIVLVLSISLMLMGGNDKRKKKKDSFMVKLLFNTLIRTSSDANIYTSPISFMNFTKNLIPATKLVNDVWKLSVTDTWKTITGNPYYYQGTKKESLRYFTDIKKILPLVTSIENTEQYLTELSKNY